jgi:hypothetical protein
MTIAASQGRLALVGNCQSDDAEPLLRHLISQPTATVDISECEGVHTAVLQVLLAAKPSFAGRAKDPFVRDWLEPLFQRS